MALFFKEVLPMIYCSTLEWKAIFCLLLLVPSAKSQVIITDPTPQCGFSGTLTASIKSPWPKNCALLTGDIVVDSTSNLTQTQLQTLFQNITAIQGTLIVRNTNLKQLLFLKNVKALHRLWGYNILEIVENSHLTQINLEKLNKSEGVVVVKDNPLLDMTKSCQLFDRVLAGSRVIVRNKVDCGFQLDFPLTFTSILNVPANLSTIHGNLHFDDTGIPPERLSVLRSVKKIIGCIIVTSTNSEALSFLEHLQEIFCKSSMYPAIKILNNHYLESMGLQELTKITTILPLEISNNRILHFTFDEAEVMVSTNVVTDRVSGAYLEEDLPSDTCIFNSLKDDIASLDDNCTSVLGLLHYVGRSFTEQEVKKFQQIRNLYGNIDLTEVNIEDLSMFSALEKIISLNATFPAIRLSSITELKSIAMPMLQKIYAPTDDKFTIKDSPNLNISSADCNFFEEVMHGPVIIEFFACDLWIEWKDGTS